MEDSRDDSESPLPEWYVLEFTFSSEDTDSTLVALCNGRRVVVHLFAENLDAAPRLKERYLFFLQVAENFELEGYTVDDFHDWIAEPLLPILQQLDSLETIPRNLETFLLPETYSYTLRADGELLVAVPYHDKNPDGPMFGISIPDNVTQSWPLFKPSSIRLCEERNGPAPPSPMPGKVLLEDGTVAFLKLLRPGDRFFALGEMDTYRQIRDAHLDKRLHISRLYGLVQNYEEEVVGLLLTYIDAGHRTLSFAAGEDADDRVRRRWAGQIESAVTQLHIAGVAWGDAKPDNVLVDRQGDAWLIDFGQSYTEDWVPKELAGTIELDLVALQKIKAFLRSE